MSRFRKAITRYRRKRILQYLQKMDPEKVETISDKRVMKTFRRAVRVSPAYRKLLESGNLDPDSIKTVAQFRDQVPVTDKQNYFQPYSFEELLGENTKGMKLAMTSSGYSGTFAYGFVGGQALRTAHLGVDLTLDYWFGISEKRTFLINCAPMGVHVETSLPLAEVSVRSDMALALLKKVSPAYEQTVIAGDPYFLKKLVEEGTEAGIPWEKLGVSLITAQDWLPESLRGYLSTLLEIEKYPASGRAIYATMGMTELGLNVFHESAQTVQIRKRIMEDPEFRGEILGSQSVAVPNVFHYYPFRTYIETRDPDQVSEFLFSVSDPLGILPVMRYSTGDKGIRISYSKIRSLLGNNSPLLPDLKLPLGILYGRTTNTIEYKERSFSLEMVKEGLFSDHHIAACVTGLVGFGMKDKTPVIRVHLGDSVQLTKAFPDELSAAVNRYLPLELDVEIIRYPDATSAIDLNYEKKLILR